MAQRMQRRKEKLNARTQRVQRRKEKLNAKAQGIELNKVFGNAVDALGVQYQVITFEQLGDAGLMNRHFGIADGKRP